MFQRTTPSDISYAVVLRLLAGLGVLILVGPVLIVLITSFTTSAALKFPPPDLSVRWYVELFDRTRSAHIHTAAGNTLWVASVATGLGTLMAVMAALSIARVNRPAARALEASFLSPLILPTLAYGLASLMLFALLGFRPSLYHLVLGHLVVISPFVFRTTLASLTQLDPSLLESSASLGASRFYTFRRITLPIIAPGVAAGAFLAFIASIDNVPVSLFLSNARTSMLPIRMWGMMESTLDVRVAAISGVLIAVILILMIVMDRLVGLTRRMGV
ncbi:MAG: ABC transporter permease [Methylocystis sp.]|jgi:putative spermidine/putrescine transport system permease protein|nr:ABC transporter permease [Methylocystis sp.]MCA3585463.1 ABC transporter permease [Methylocystis sp.]MCA3588707.1 ABC transporter permease [Methylocystis sp.]MCA3592484.1 ABC transporter permease [Methylocystis sp.]